MGTESSFWERVSKKWKYLAPPFRPDPQDTDFISGVINSDAPTFNSNRIVILGVTPEYAALNIPEGCEMIGVDNCKQMIDNVWPEMSDPNKKTILADWLNLPFENNSCDIVMGDGVMGTMRYPNQVKEFLQTIKNALHPDGLFIFRTFLRDDVSETPNDVFDAVMNGEIQTLSSFKFRLMRSVQPNLETGAQLSNVWNTMVNEGPDFEELTTKTGWEIEELETMKLYNGSGVVVTYPTLSELRDILKEEGFQEVDHFCPDYELGEFCQTLVFTPAE